MVSGQQIEACLLSSIFKEQTPGKDLLLYFRVQTMDAYSSLPYPWYYNTKGLFPRSKEPQHNHYLSQLDVEMILAVDDPLCLQLFFLLDSGGITD